MEFCIILQSQNRQYSSFRKNVGIFSICRVTLRNMNASNQGIGALKLPTSGNNTFWETIQIFIFLNT